ncbi:flagellar hook-associated protein FlgL [Paenibacillus thiaminolyticus]|uniref:Flagellar hook-associated protein 3 n=1 Tax=Paenibacillus thiaminolyticus TaxID=49283 RepID=A0AAP9DYC6_PANTH|nr:flagellar hook-associated protein FlgL [Paenibacillus thiaminolyticus]MCY9538202.1 flagellar hook-associated protein FlgL [Paenibacillus thiaminolyticus]MCY9602812.1 flagellar hook-associated protein FlgL [Paenibacillus thiaminolyticus]MCY9610797.1 flagellar hook-associated protein FlgL [Paenibacillus thiaminolyticus]MCY9615068.1 flagellar hook-associated protein FlgL [Paenibacillus thiaminolyticus]MCY9621317.1 flagellar hook-associated protein FlgL [Paenibacillus thiaminolyticus]
MRVTSAMQNTQLLRNMRYMNSNAIDLNNKLSSGQRIHRPGDDPVGIGYQMRYDSELNRNDEFTANAQMGTGMLRTMDSLMQQASDVLKRVRTLVQQGSTGTTPDDARVANAAELKQLKEQLVMIGNSSYNGRYLFNGQKTDIPPYTSAGAATETTDEGIYRLNVSPAVTVPVSITGELIFGKAIDTTNPIDKDNDNVFQMMDDMIKAAEENDIDGLLNGLERIDASSDRINTQWSEIGARMNRFELMENRLADDKVSLKTERGQVADVDMPEAIIALKTQENVMQAALATGARIMQVSLIDFIR